MTSKQAVYSEDRGNPEYEFAREAREQAKLNQIFHGREDRLTNKFHELEEWEKRLKIISVSNQKRKGARKETIFSLFTTIIPGGRYPQNSTYFKNHFYQVTDPFLRWSLYSLIGARGSNRR